MNFSTFEKLQLSKLSFIDKSVYTHSNFKIVGANKPIVCQAHNNVQVTLNYFIPWLTINQWCCIIILRGPAPSLLLLSIMLLKQLCHHFFLLSFYCKLRCQAAECLHFPQVLDKSKTTTVWSICFADPTTDNRCNGNDYSFCFPSGVRPFNRIPP